jgi:hypothetical protein
VGSYFATALCLATGGVIGQESAEAIVGMEPTTLGGVVGGNEPGEKKAGRSHPAEGPNPKYGESSIHAPLRDEPERGSEYTGAA